MTTPQKSLKSTLWAMARQAARGLATSGEAVVSVDAAEPAKKPATDQNAAVKQVQTALEAAVAGFPGIEELTEAEVEAAFAVAFAQVSG
jgi:hypothetical protein